MTISTAWSITLCNREVSTGKIVQVDAKCVATDSAEPTSEDGSTALVGESVVYVELEGDLTVPYSDVKEADVIGWVKERLGEDDVSRIEQEAKDSLNQQSVTTAYGLPWVTD
jgi:hypothetical protein